MSQSLRLKLVTLVTLYNSFIIRLPIVCRGLWASTQVLASSQKFTRWNVEFSYKKFSVTYIPDTSNKIFFRCVTSSSQCNPVSLGSFKDSCKNTSFIQHYCTDMADNKYVVGYAKLGTSGCKKCKQKIAKGALRIGKLVRNPFGSDGGDMKQWHHPNCIFDTFQRARPTTKKIEEPDDMEGFSDLRQEDKNSLIKLINGKSDGLVIS